MLPKRKLDGNFKGKTRNQDTYRLGFSEFSDNYFALFSGFIAWEDVKNLRSNYGLLWGATIPSKATLICSSTCI